MVTSKIARQYTETCKRRLDYDKQTYRQAIDELEDVHDKVVTLLDLIEDHHELMYVREKLEQFISEYEYMRVVLRDESLACRFGIIAIDHYLEEDSSEE